MRKRLIRVRVEVGFGGPNALVLVACMSLAAEYGCGRFVGGA